MAGAALLVTACAPATVVNTDEPRPTSTSQSVPVPAPAIMDRRLVNAFDYVAHVGDRAGYYFTTPSGKWDCAILPRDRAGCQSASGWPAALGIPQEPDTVAGAGGEQHAPNALVVDRFADAHFAALADPEFALSPRPAKVLEFDQILSAGGFRCNVQDAGVSCMSERTQRGFTFSGDGFELRYRDLPPAG